MHKLLYTERIPGGSSWSGRLRRGQGIRIRDLSGSGNAVFCLWNAHDPFERLNIPDSLKSQRIARFAAPCTFQSDMGRALASMIEDTCGWHDALGGLADHARSVAKFGESSYQDVRNARVTNARDHFLVELGKYGLGERDIPSVVNLFSRVSVGSEGAITWDPRPQPGRSATLRFEMDVLVVLSATPHPLDPSTTWAPGDLEMDVLCVQPPSDDDAVRNFCPENARALELSARLFPGDWP